MPSITTGHLAVRARTEKLTSQRTKLYQEFGTHEWFALSATPISQKKDTEYKWVGRGSKSLEPGRGIGRRWRNQTSPPLLPMIARPWAALLCCLPPPCLPLIPSRPPLSLSPSPSGPLPAPPHFLPCSLSLQRAHVREHYVHRRFA